MSREPRNTEKRAYDSHVADSRPVMTFGEDSGFNIPEQYKEPGWSYSFVPYVCAGQELHHEYESALERRKFEPVTESTHPGLKRRSSLSPFSRKDDSDGLIKRGGQVLLRRPQEVADAEAKFYDEKNRRQQIIVDQHRNSPHDPKLFVDDRQWSRG